MLLSSQEETNPPCTKNRKFSQINSTIDQPYYQRIQNQNGLPAKSPHHSQPTTNKLMDFQPTKAKVNRLTIQKFPNDSNLIPLPIQIPILIILIQIYKQQKNTMKRDTLFFIIAVSLWEIAVAIIYGLAIRYNQPLFSSMATVPYQYTFADQSPTFKFLTANSTQPSFVYIVVVLAFVFIIVGLALVGSYVERMGVTNMAFTILLLGLTVQNFFIFRDFFDRAALNNPNASSWFNNNRFQKICPINFSNSLLNNHDLPSASFLDSLGAVLALYTSYTAVMGRIGLGHIFVLSFLGTFVYELNSMLLWRLWIPDTGYPSRAFAFGSVLGIVSSLILGQRQLTKKNINYLSSYTMRVLPLLGIIIVWCTYPILILSTNYNSTSGEIIAMASQVNIWLALAASAIGVYIASMYMYKKFNVFNLVFSALSGAIAYSSSSDSNFNPGGAITIGSIVGLVCALSQDKLRRAINRQGVIDSNSVVFSFLLPSCFAAIASAVLVGIDQSSSTATVAVNSTLNTTLTYGPLIAPGRTAPQQGGYMLAGWSICVGLGLIAGVIIGLIYRALDDRQKDTDFFSDIAIFSAPGKKLIEQ